MNLIKKVKKKKIHNAVNTRKLEQDLFGVICMKNFCWAKNIITGNIMVLNTAHKFP